MLAWEKFGASMKVDQKQEAGGFGKEQLSGPKEGSIVSVLAGGFQYTGKHS